MVERLEKPRARTLSWRTQTLMVLTYFAGGFLLSACALGGFYMPLSLGLLCASSSGWGAVLLALGGCAGYWCFWGLSGVQAMAWMAGGLAVATIAGDRGISRRQPLLLPAMAMLVVSAWGMIFQLRWKDQTPVVIYLLRVGVAALSCWIFFWQRVQPGQWSNRLAQMLVILALGQIRPIPYLGFGFVAAGAMAAAGSLPGAVLTGLALDAAQVTPMCMTLVLGAAWGLRQLPGQHRAIRMLAAAACFGLTVALWPVKDLEPLPGLLLGGVIGSFLPGTAPKGSKRLSDPALAQLRLAQMSAVLRQMEQSLLPSYVEIDRPGLLAHCHQAACDGCPERKPCKARLEPLPEDLLDIQGLSQEQMPKGCKKPGRLHLELRRGQERLRRIQADRSRLDSYRAACRDQYGLLADFLQDLSDDLMTRRKERPMRFQPEIGVSTLSREEANGDVCVWFSGPGNRFFILLCDGMGTGEGAATESREAVELLRQMLKAGIPPAHALRSLNSLAVLREAGACTTVDLVQLGLDSGKGVLYKWGAAPSFLLSQGQLRKIGTATPPPGLSQQSRETADRLSLNGGETLILLSDGTPEDGLRHRLSPEQSPGEMAASILEQGSIGADDATAVVIRLTAPGTPRS